MCRVFEMTLANRDRPRQRRGIAALAEEFTREPRTMTAALDGNLSSKASLISLISCDTDANRGGLRPGQGRFDKEAVMEFPKCQKCSNGILIPLSDYGQEGASVMFKAWVCTNPDCGFSLRVDKGEVSYGKKIEHKH